MTAAARNTARELANCGALKTRDPRVFYLENSSLHSHRIYICDDGRVEESCKLHRDFNRCLCVVPCGVQAVENA